MFKFKQSVLTLIIVSLIFMILTNLSESRSEAENIKQQVTVTTTDTLNTEKERNNFKAISAKVDKLKEAIEKVPPATKKFIVGANKAIAEEKKQFGVVTTSLLNVRKSPEIKGNNIIGGFEMGTEFLIEDKKNGWLKTEKGWIYSQYTKSVARDKTKVKKNKKIYLPYEDLIIDINGPASTNINISRLDKPSGMTLEQMEHLIDQFELIGIKNSRFKGTAKDLLIAERKYNVNALFVLSIGIHESYYGTSALARNKNNLFGLMGGTKTGLYYSSRKECIDYEFRLMRNEYINRGLTTVSKISYKYCNPPQHWAVSISNLMVKSQAKAVKYAVAKNKVQAVQVAKK